MSYIYYEANTAAIAHSIDRIIIIISTYIIGTSDDLNIISSKK